jgi:hypothetical protein
MNIQSTAEARQAVRGVRTKAQAERVQRERDNVEDTATFVVARGRVAGVDEWEAERVAQVAAEAARRRDEHRLVGAAAARIRERGESVREVAALAQTSETEVRAHLRLADAASSAAGAPAVSAARPRWVH